MATEVMKQRRRIEVQAAALLVLALVMVWMTGANATRRKAKLQKVEWSYCDPEAARTSNITAVGMHPYPPRAGDKVKLLVAGKHGKTATKRNETRRDERSASAVSRARRYCDSDAVGRGLPARARARKREREREGEGGLQAPQPLRPTHLADSSFLLRCHPRQVRPSTAACSTLGRTSRTSRSIRVRRTSAAGPSAPATAPASSCSRPWKSCPGTHPKGSTRSRSRRRTSTGRRSCAPGPSSP